jgi:hypothetical protein
MSGNVEGSHERYWDSIRKAVCEVCLDQGPEGRCGLRDRTCAIRTFLPTLVKTVAPIESRRMDDYFDAVEASICAQCEFHRGPGAECALRDKGECALYAYLPLVVDALQEALEAESAPAPSAVAERVAAGVAARQQDTSCR